ncbi:hypothetical protein GIB67_016008, partial [Kingdonia uniflora]
TSNMQKALKRNLNARIEHTKLLQDTVKEMAKEVQNSKSGEIKKTGEDKDAFFEKINRAAPFCIKEILGFANLLNNELTLDNISRPRLDNMCMYMGIYPCETDAYLRYMLTRSLAMIEADNRLIQQEGVESLLDAELREESSLLVGLCLNHSVPFSLLIFSRAFNVSRKFMPEEAVQATLSSLSDEVMDTLGRTALASEVSVSGRRKLELLETQELIKSVSGEYEDFLGLVNKEIGLYNSMVQKEGTYEESLNLYGSARKKAAEVPVENKVSSELIDKVDAMLQNLEKELNNIGDSLGDSHKLQKLEMEIPYTCIELLLPSCHSHQLPLVLDLNENFRLSMTSICRGYDDKVIPEEVATTAIHLKNNIDKKYIQELINNLSKNEKGNHSFFLHRHTIFFPRNQVLCT